MAKDEHLHGISLPLKEPAFFNTIGEDLRQLNLILSQMFKMFERRSIRKFAAVAIASVVAFALILLQGNFLVSASTTNQAQTPSAFIEMCESRETLAPNIRTTIDSMLREIDLPNSTCAEANERFSRLRRIALYAEQEMDFSPLQFFPNITSLDLFNDQMTDLSSLHSLTHLNYLRIINRQNNIDLNPLQSLTNLTDLSVIGRQITSLEPLQSLTNLVFLNVQGNQIADISPLEFLTNLTTLFLFDNRITDLSPLRTLTSLTELHLANNQITDLSPLQPLTNLTKLYLGRNQIVDVGPLRSLISLEGLDLGDNQIMNLSPLSSLRNLRSLVVANNPISQPICPVNPSSICHFELPGGTMIAP